ncbi:MAG: C25 family cysteine peptidase [Bacteroidales bacterium]|nr:C25 family cysteine peptidase [Bacteroidales bacterium]
MKKFILSVVVSLFLGITFGQEIKISQQFKDLELETITFNGQTYYTLNMGEELLSSNKVGQADLPTYNCLIEIPFCSDVIIEQNILSKETINLKNGWKIYPKQPSQSKQNEDIPFAIDKDYYSRNSFGQTDIAQIEILGVMNGVRLARLSICPIRYNPSTAQIEHIKQVDLNLSFVNPDLEKTNKMKSKLSKSFNKFLGNKVVNFNKSTSASSFNSPMTRPFKMIILSSPIFREELQSFIQWKKQQGFEIVELYTDEVGTTATAIKNYLHNLWANSNGDFADYLLICGDTGQIPACEGVHMYYSNDSQPTDLYYAEYTGDILPDVFYGRFSASSTSQMRNIIEKTIKYEKYAFENNEYLNKVLLVGGKETSGNAPTCVNGHLNYAKQYFAGMDTSIYYNPSSANYVSEIKQKMNEGRSWINYSAHCDETGWSNPAFTKTNVSQMSNTGKYSFFINNCCLSSRYNVSECFGEKLLRAEDKGAIGVIGGSNYTYWDEDFYWAVGAKSRNLNPTYNSNKLGCYDRFFHTHGEEFGECYVSAGEIVVAGNFAVTTSGSNLTEYYWEIYNLLGDPSLIPHLGEGLEFNVDLPELLSLGESELNLEGLPAYTYVGVSLEGELLGATQANSDGVATINFEPINDVSYLNVVLTNQFYKTKIDSILVSPSQDAFISLKDVKFIDAETMQEASKLTPSKEYFLNFTAKNVGNQPLANTTITLSNATNLSIVVGTQNFGEIDANAERQSTNTLKIKINDGLFDGTNVSFTANITGTNYSKTKDISKKVASPRLVISSIKISDITDGKLVRVTLSNNGSVEVGEGTLKVMEISDWVNLSSNSEVVPTLAPNTDTEVSFTMNVAEDVFSQQDSLFFTLDYVCGHYMVSKSYVIDLLSQIESFESGDFTSVDWEMDSSYPWIIDSTSANTGSFSARSANISHNETTTLTIKVNNMLRDSISFHYKVSTENNYDFFRFYIDGTQKIKESGTSNTEWNYKKYTLTAGEHILKWEYSKDQSQSSGEDCVRIDDIKLPNKAYCVGLENNVELYDVNIYPNPTKDYVVLSNLKGESQITIIDINGRMRYYQNTSSNQVEINLNGLESGVYNLNVIKDNIVLSKKLVIE